MAGTLAICKRADGLGGLVFVCHEQVIKAFVAEGLEEPFASTLLIMSKQKACF